MELYDPLKRIDPDFVKPTVRREIEEKFNSIKDEDDYEEFVDEYVDKYRTKFERCLETFKKLDENRDPKTVALLHPVVEKGGHD